MKEIKSPVKSEKFQACVLVDKNNEVAWCVYHPDDGGDKLIFTKSLVDIEDIEHFKNTTEEEIIAHLNKNGFEIEPEEDFGDVILYSNLTNEYTVKLIDVQFNKMFSINFTL
jgi:hypothetical protein